MSAIDDLKSYEQDWQRANGKCKGEGAGFVKIHQESGQSRVTYRMDLPQQLRQKVAALAEAELTELVLKVHQALLTELRAAAKAEAQEVLRELG